MLFKKLPDEIFQPLSGQNRHVYQAVLLELADLFFDEDVIDPFLPKDLVRSTIEEAVIKFGVRQWAPEGDESPEDDEQGPPRSTAEYTSRIYRRLVKAGWLDEEQRLYRTYVLIAPSISYLLRTLVQIANFQKKSYGGAVLNVLSSVEAAIKDPEGRGLTLQEAAKSASEFSAHLTDMLLGLREMRIDFAATNNPKEIVRGFFQQFVARILVSDYKTLKTKNNPFRFRRQILALLRDLQFDERTMAQLVTHYQDQLEISALDAEAQVRQHITRIIRIFESVDERLATIDDFRFKLEKRVADTVRYMDKTTPGMSARLSRMIAAVAKKPEAEIPMVPTLDEVGFLSPRSVRMPAKKRKAPEPQVIRQAVIDPEVLAMRELFKAYKQRRQVNGPKIQDYLNRHMEPGQCLSADQFRIDTIEDYICFSYVRHLPSLGKKGKQVAANYQIEFGDRYVNVADMVECRDFTIQRKS